MKPLLLIEDDLIYAGFVRSTIKHAQLPFDVHHVTTVPQALEYLSGEPPFNDRTAHPLPAIILLDIVLAAQLGFPVLDWLNEHGLLKSEKVRVIMLTAS